MTEQTLVALRDYGALGTLLILLILALVRERSDAKEARKESDDRIKAQQDQIDRLNASKAEDAKEIARTTAEANARAASDFAAGMVKQSELFADTSARQADTFAGVVRDSTQAQREFNARLLDLADRD